MPLNAYILILKKHSTLRAIYLENRSWPQTDYEFKYCTEVLKGNGNVG